MNEPMHRKNKEGFGMQTKASYDDGASKRGTYISKTGKMHCISSNFKSIAYLFCRYFMKTKFPTGSNETQMK
jgi:hypothetical protein